MAVHCVIHWQHLVAKHLEERLHDFLHYVINAVNKIKVQSLNEHLFHRFCQNHDKEFKRLSIHTKVRWLSKEKCLRCFYKLFDTVVEFLWPIDPSLCDAIELWHLDVAYLADIFDKLSEVNTKLQEDKMNFIKAKDFDIFCSHLKQTKEDMQRSHDLCTLEIPTWILNPFSADAGDFQPRLQEQLIDLKHNSEAQALFQQCSYECFGVKVKNSYPILWQEVKLLVLAFPSTFLVERSFSAVQQLLKKAGNKLQICVRGDL
ncbi:hypothetical protein GDO78_000452 [Eleutherodactylus coqui]|uniref:SCAN domain-containing protein 3 n=1 Tax=Eleutherodactylus coqui TaxID=57060 RepID=A0A8J6FQ04_ELECQ|nr:hypothetical protein GDO78_000452 [Eleutherodactylus coqui]